ncbi:hypothetical protein EZV62_028040 [Acer yangbiense]|uniref:Uncharacterized protein n=1 Tax=Acer yangbiense TaxID=1000413 RepID=A0A5C7GQ63_9ROSI|nr:hypothetical protein EZV62_028040 [Acer yangbiense]
MAQDSRIVLTVAHFRDGDNNPAGTCEDWDRMRDSIVLREVKTNGYINYMEKEVADGPETAMTIHSMVNDFDMIIVGRRNNVESQQTTGLKQWSEFPELGVLGDLLASIDYAGRCSVLVVQQQETSLEEDLSSYRGELTRLLTSEEAGTPPKTSQEDDPSCGDVAGGGPTSSGNVGAQGGEELVVHVMFIDPLQLPMLEVQDLDADCKHKTRKGSGCN